MERLTEWIGTGDSRKALARQDRRDIGDKDCIARLAVYEDTGLGPAEITTEPYGCVFYCNRKCNLDSDFCAEGPGCPHEIDTETAKHLLELAQAEKDGRLVVLPCNIHQPLYILKSGEIHQNYGCQWHFTDKECQAFGTLSMYGECVRLDDFGKTVFLTREEAEAALEKREEAGL